MRQLLQSTPLTRRAVSAFAAGLLVMTGAVSMVMLSGPASAAGTQLFPNLQTLPPRDLRFADTNVSSDPNVTTMHRVLQFSNTVTNSGAGRLELRAHINGTLNPPSGPAYERVYDTAGGYTDYAVGSMYYHAVHAHYHYDGWGQYQLWTKADYDTWLKSGRTTGKPKALGAKTTSCVLDEEFVHTLPATPYPARYGGGGCQTDANGNLIEGLSPGWGDTYDWYRFEQWIDLGPAGTSLADGTYVLRSVTDPNNQIYESAGKADTSVESAADNEAITVFSVSGSQILDADAPTGSLSLNHVDSSTSVPNVTASVVGRDDVSGVTAFRLSNDGTTWSPQFAYTTSASTPTEVSWSLTDSRYGGTSASGAKTVYAQFLDRSGKWGPATSDSIDFSPATASAYSSGVVGDGPAGYWRLGETSGSTAVDVKGTHPGTYVGGVSLGQAGLLTNDPDKAIATNGSTGYVSVPSASDLTAPALSVEAWVHPDAIPAAGSWASIASKAESYSLQFNGPLLEFTLINGSGTRARLQAPSGAVVAGRTYHVVGTYDGTTARLYVNGSQVASSGSGWAPAPTTKPLTIGSWSGTEFFRGGIDEVAVYPKALTAARVSAHYATGTSTTTPTTTTYAVNVATSGAGAGTVTSSPSGINCPSTCSAAVPASTSVTLTAAAATGSTFGGWTGACTGTASTCTFTAYAATSAAAVFNTAAASYQLALTKGGAGGGSVSSSPSGISCGSACTAGFPSGTTVTLTASPATGSVFAGWAGGCAGTASTCTVTMSANMSVSATFQPAASQTLTVVLSGSGSGTVTSSPAGVSCGSSCSASFATGTKVTLTAVPATGAVFSGWKQGCSGTSPTCVVIMNGPVTAAATFN